MLWEKSDRTTSGWRHKDDRYILTIKKPGKSQEPSVYGVFTKDEAKEMKKFLDTIHFVDAKTGKVKVVKLQFPQLMQEIIMSKR
jgi:hypothetical protein